MSEEPMARIPLDGFAELDAELAAILRDPDRLGRLDVDKKTIERWRRDGMPKQLRLFVHDPRMARALLAGVERQAA